MRFPVQLFDSAFLPLLTIFNRHLTLNYRVKEARDPKLSNAYNYTIYKEDHTLGNLIRMYVPLFAVFTFNVPW